MQSKTYVHVQTKLRTHSLNVLKTLLEVRTRTTNPNLHLVLNKQRSNFAERTNNTLERARDVGEVSNTTTNEQDLALRVLRRPQHKVKDCASVVEGLCLGRSTRVLSVVGEFAGETGGSNGISVHDGRTTTSDQSPNATLRVQDSQLERSTGLGVHFGDVCFFFGKLTAERGRELHWWTGVDLDFSAGGLGGEAEVCGGSGNGPFYTAFELCGLIEFCGQVEEVDFGGGLGFVGDDDEGVDFEVAVGLMLLVICLGSRFLPNLGAFNGLT